MKRTLLLSALAALFALNAHAQYETVVYDYSKNRFGENQPLPAEQQWMLSGETPKGIEMVEIQIFQPKKSNPRLLYSSDYQRADGSESDRFTVPVNFKLHGNTAYDFRILYFKEASDSDMRRLSEMVNAALTSYLNQSVVAGKRHVSLAKHPRIMIQELDHIVSDGLELYRNRMGVTFDGFSDIVYDKLERMDDLKLKAARFNILKEPDADKRQTRVAYFQQNLEELAKLLEREVNHYLSGNFYVLREARTVSNYKSENTRSTLPINLGYAAVHDNLTSDGFAVEGAPMVGISFPLGNPNFANSFWSNSSLSAGLLLQNVTLDGDRVQSGPLVDRPLYFAYGYKTAYFLRINAGAVVMEEAGSGTVRVSPFVGLSVELNLWLGLNR